MLRTTCDCCPANNQAAQIIITCPDSIPLNPAIVHVYACMHACMQRNASTHVPHTHSLTRCARQQPRFLMHTSVPDHTVVHSGRGSQRPWSTSWLPSGVAAAGAATASGWRHQSCWWLAALHAAHTCACSNCMQHMHALSAYCALQLCPTWPQRHPGSGRADCAARCPGPVRCWSC